MKINKWSNVLIIIIGVILYFICIINILESSQQQKKSSSKLDRKIQNNAFRVGEKLRFTIKWGIITAGYATLEVRNVIDLGEYKAYEIVSEARSNSFFDIFYKVRDRVKSYIDKDGIYSWRFEKHLREGKYHHDEVIIYDQEKHFADFNGKVLEIPEYVNDILSAFYYVRTQKLIVGQELRIPVNAGDKNYELIVKVLEKTRIKISKGKFDVILVEPLVKYEGIFQHKGKLLIWLTDDERKIPVLMRSKIAVGSIDAELVELSLP